VRRIRFTLSYDGTEFHGWQIQPGLPTIQGELERILAEIEGAPVKVHGSGRTDAGVHALAQVAAFDLVNPIPAENLRKAVNRLLPPSIRVWRTEETHLGFHPRYDAVAKTYEYRIFREEVCPPFEFRYVHHHPYPLDEARMIEAAPVFEGEHDFTAFAAADERDEQGFSKVRVIFSSKLWREGPRLIYRVRGSGFLKHMVRNLVGALIEVGKGNESSEGIGRWLRHPPVDTAKAGPTARARGLFQISVEYPALAPPQLEEEAAEAEEGHSPSGES
jgi:tRNA pseudouridine38-40 synthase